jgi:uncharacterized protein YciI
MKSFIFFYFMNDRKEEIRNSAPKHSEYWRELKPENYKGGPFADYSGGLITFNAVSLETAEKFISNDPFITSNCLQEYWLKEWKVT